MLPFDYICSTVFAVLCIIDAPWYICAGAVPLALFNLRRYLQKDHKMYFITKKEY